MKKLKPYFEIFPVVFILIFVLFFGIVTCLMQSFGYYSFANLDTFTFQYYKKILTDKNFLDALMYSLKISFISSFLSVVLGVALAKFIVDTGFKHSFLYNIPVLIPHIIVALFSITFLSENGIISRIFYVLGFKNASALFSNILFSRNGLGVILSYMWKEIPFILVTILSLMERISSKHEQIAINLGASKFYAFWKITLPMILPSICSCFTIVFSFSFGAYELPFLLGSVVPKALPVMAFIEYQNPILENRPYAMAINVVIILLGILFLIIFNKLIKILIVGRKKIEKTF